jgi:hypothetical protein
MAWECGDFDFQWTRNLGFKTWHGKGGDLGFGWTRNLGFKTLHGKGEQD